MTRKWIVRLALLLVVTSTIGCDQVTKRLAAEHLMGAETQSLLGDTVRLAYAENTGAFLSLGAELSPGIRTAIFSVGCSVMLLACAFVAFRNRRRLVPMFALALVCAGGLSNVMDRIARGSVIDFLNVGIGSLRTGIFNVADVAILAGVIVLLFHKQGAADGDRKAPGEVSSAT